MPKPAINAFSVFVEEMAKKNGVPMNRAFQRFERDWANLSEDKKASYKERARNLKRGCRFDIDGSQVDCRGRTLGSLEREAADKEKMQQEMRESIQMALFGDEAEGAEATEALEAAARRKAILETAFIAIHINFHSKVDNVHPEVLPAEIALAEFSLKDGVRRVWHAFIAPKKVPLGYAYICRAHAEKTHNIPLDGFEMAVQDHGFLKDTILEFLGGCGSGPSENQPQQLPILFCMGFEEEEVFGKALDQLLGLEEHQVRLFDLAELAFEMEASIDELATLYRCPDIVGPRVGSVVEARLFLESDPFQYRTLPLDSCGFHCPLDNVTHCSLSIVKRRIFAIAERSSAAMSVRLERGKHLPKGKDAELPPLAPDKVVNRAVRRDYVSQFGVELPRGDVRNGSTPLPDTDPVAALINAASSSENSLFGSRNSSSSRTLSNLSNLTLSSDTTLSITTSSDLSTTMWPEVSAEKNKMWSKYKESFADKVKSSSKR